jgi:flagellar biosynthesis chaperone FliJ
MAKSPTQLSEAREKLAEYDLSPEDVGLGAIVRRVRADRIELANAKAESESRMKALESLRKTNQDLVFSYEDTKEKLSNVRSFVSSLEETIARQRDELNILRKVVDAKEPAKMRAKMQTKKVGRS